jgi:hypothetical protein
MCIQNSNNETTDASSFSLRCFLGVNASTEIALTFDNACAPCESFTFQKGRTATARQCSNTRKIQPKKRLIQEDRWGVSANKVEAVRGQLALLKHTRTRSLPLHRGSSRKSRPVLIAPNTLNHRRPVRRESMERPSPNGNSNKQDCRPMVPLRRRGIVDTTSVLLGKLLKDLDILDASSSVSSVA